jgi:hypothetical protein
MRNTVDYESDFYGWAMRQAELLREGRLSEADIENIAEEIESLGRGERRELVNRLKVLLAHLLKWQFQPGHRGNSWRLTIREQRKMLRSRLAQNPSLRPRLQDAIAEAYDLAMLIAQRETGLAEGAFPASCSYGAEEILDPDFLPQ